MNTEKVIEHLLKTEKRFTNTLFSKKPGIYAIFFVGDVFPLLRKGIKKHQIIYIGKTESSQEKRDAKTHFSDGKTGSSTVRKSIGALLYNDGYKMYPIPRNNTDFKNNRFSHFMFDKDGERYLTKWMIDNLALSFYEYDGDKTEIESMERCIIQAIVPVLNIQNNPMNPFLFKLKELKRICAKYAHTGIDRKSKEKYNDHPISEMPNPSQIKGSSNTTTHKYIDLWNDKLTEIIGKLKIAGSIQFIEMNVNDFLRVGKRKSYSFNLEYFENKTNNIGGSAVARDLNRVLSRSQEAMIILSKGHYKLSMGKDFCLSIQKLG